MGAWEQAKEEVRRGAPLQGASLEDVWRLRDTGADAECVRVRVVLSELRDEVVVQVESHAPVAVVLEGESKRTRLVRRRQEAPTPRVHAGHSCA